MKPYAFGVDIGGTTVKIGFFETAGTLVKKWEIPTRKENQGGQILPDIAEAIKGELAERGLTIDDVEGIGMGVPGPVLNETTVNKCVNLGWDVFDVAAEMSRLTGVAKVKAGNDANVAALGEMWQGGGKGHSNVVMVTLGTGVGGGIIVDGKIVAGAFGAGGEIGHIKMSDTETECCGCGKKGCLEQYASATGIVRKTKSLLAETDTPSVLRDLAEVTAKDALDAARDGDAMGCEILEFVGDQLGRALSYISCVVDPEIYVIGGGVSKAGAILIDSIRDHFVQNAFHASRVAQFEQAKLGNDAGMYGSVKLVL